MHSKRDDGRRTGSLGIKPFHDRALFGWNGPARTMLALSATIAGLVLAWTSSGPPPREVEVPALVVDANSAPLPVLGALPGLGPALSSRIVAARPFASLDDFDRRVAGIGPAKVAALRPFLRFDPPPVPTP